jgi:hypothetical protein
LNGSLGPYLTLYEDKAFVWNLGIGCKFDW